MNKGNDKLMILKRLYKKYKVHGDLTMVAKALDIKHQKVQDILRVQIKCKVSLEKIIDYYLPILEERRKLTVKNNNLIRKNYSKKLVKN